MVIGVRHIAPPLPVMPRPATTTHVAAWPPIISTARPAIISASPIMIGSRAPKRPTIRPTSGETIVTLAENGSIMSPVTCGGYPRTFCRNCVVRSSMP